MTHKGLHLTHPTPRRGPSCHQLKPDGGRGTDGDPELISLHTHCILSGNPWPPENVYQTTEPCGLLLTDADFRSQGPPEPASFYRLFVVIKNCEGWKD